MNDALFRTEDGGASWQRERDFAYDSFRSVAFANEEVGAVVGWPKTLWTTDGGRSWTEAENDLSLIHVAFLTRATAIAVGYGGVIFVTP